MQAEMDVAVLKAIMTDPESKPMKQKCPVCGLTYNPRHFKNLDGKVPDHRRLCAGPYGPCEGQRQKPKVVAK